MHVIQRDHDSHSDDSETRTEMGLDRVCYQIIQTDDSSYDDVVSDLFARHDYSLVKREWVDWKYEQNPHGRSILTLAMDKADCPVGVVGLLPRVYRHKHKEFMTVQVVDAFVDPAHRRQGILQKMVRKMRAIIRRRNLVLTVFSDVHDVSLGAFRKEKLHRLGFLEVLVFPIRPSRILFHKIGYRLTTRIARLSLDLLCQRKLASNESIVEAREYLRFDEQEDLPSRTVRGVRDADYLNWRFHDNPTESFLTIGLYDQGEKIGYAALRYDADGYTMHVHDFLVSRLEIDSIRAVQQYVLNNCTSVGLISFAALEQSPFYAALRSCGFRSRGRGSVISLDNQEAATLPTEVDQWFGNNADSDW